EMRAGVVLVLVRLKWVLVLVRLKWVLVLVQLKWVLVLVQLKSFTLTFCHLADAFVQSDVQGRELVDANWKAVLRTEHISHLTQNPRSYRDLNSDRWIQSPEC